MAASIDCARNRAASQKEAVETANVRKRVLSSVAYSELREYVEISRANKRKATSVRTAQQDTRSQSLIDRGIGGHQRESRGMCRGSPERPREEGCEDEGDREERSLRTVPESERDPVTSQGPDGSCDPCAPFRRGEPPATNSRFHHANCA